MTVSPVAPLPHTPTGLTLAVRVAAMVIAPVARVAVAYADMRPHVPDPISQPASHGRINRQMTTATARGDGRHLAHTRRVRRQEIAAAICNDAVQRSEASERLQ